MSSLIELKKTLTPDEREILRSELDRKKKSTGIAYFLWFILSFIGLHKFYLGRPLKGFLFLLAPSVSLYLFFGELLITPHANISQESNSTYDT